MALSNPLERHSVDIKKEPLIGVFQLYWYLGLLLSRSMVAPDISLHSLSRRSASWAMARIFSLDCTPYSFYFLILALSIERSLTTKFCALIGSVHISWVWSMDDRTGHFKPNHRLRRESGGFPWYYELRRWSHFKDVLRRLWCWSQRAGGSEIRWKQSHAYWLSPGIALTQPYMLTKIPKYSYVAYFSEGYTDYMLMYN